MSQIISKADKQKLYQLVKNHLGYPKRNFELDDEMLDSNLILAISDYSSLINNWLVEQQWSTLQNLDLDTADISLALTTKTLDFEKSFTDAYSKQVGLGAGAKVGWELKKDYIVVSGDVQVYSLPANREINEVLWFTPAHIDQGLIDPMAVSNWGASAFGWNYMGRPAQYMQPTFSLMLSAQDRAFKRRLIQSDLTYRVTGGPSGTKLLYLYPIPGSRLEITGKWGKTLEGSKVWYFYYDTTSKTKNRCIKANKDIIRLPSDVPIDELKWDDLNSISQTRVRKLFFAYVKKNIGRIRGFFSGDLSLPDIQLTMDYRMLLDEGESEEKAVIEETMNSLEKVSLKTLMEDRASIAENLNKALQYQPFKNPVIIR
jgi:hypothetical protein